MILPISAGYDGTVGKAKDNTTVRGATYSAGLKASLPVEIHGTVAYTKVIGFNAPRTAKKIVNKIIEWVGDSIWKKLCAAQKEAEKENEQKGYK